MGSDYKKPDATTVISRENYREILWPMPAGSLFSVGKATADKLTAMGIHTIGDLAQADRGMLCAALGKMGGIICDYAAGRDDSPVALANDERAYKSVGNGITFKRDLLGEQDARRAVTVSYTHLFIPEFIQDVGEYFEEGELCGIYLNFSDPWPKARHAKRRLTHRRYLEGYRRVLAKGCLLYTSWKHSALQGWWKR